MAGLDSHFIEGCRQGGVTDPRTSRELWKKMADLGWLGLVIPEKYGGTGLAFMDLFVLLEEMGRA